MDSIKRQEGRHAGNKATILMSKRHVGACIEPSDSADHGQKFASALLPRCYSIKCPCGWGDCLLHMGRCRLQRSVSPEYICRQPAYWDVAA